MVKIHSISHAITNSSTSIYVTATDTGINFIKQFVNQVLVDAGSELTCDDMYDIKVEECLKYYDEVYSVETMKMTESYKITPKGEHSNIDVLNAINDLFNLEEQ
jgi:hypothetical protein